jgi:hypothetical protein
VIDNHILTPLAFSAFRQRRVFRRGFHAVKKTALRFFILSFSNGKTHFLFADIHVTRKYPCANMFSFGNFSNGKYVRTLDPPFPEG